VTLTLAQHGQPRRVVLGPPSKLSEAFPVAAAPGDADLGAIAGIEIARGLELVATRTKRALELVEKLRQGRDPLSGTRENRCLGTPADIRIAALRIVGAQAQDGRFAIGIVGPLDLPIDISNRDPHPCSWRRHLFLEYVREDSPGRVARPEILQNPGNRRLPAGVLSVDHVQPVGEVVHSFGRECGHAFDAA